MKTISLFIIVFSLLIPSTVFANTPRDVKIHISPTIQDLNKKCDAKKGEDIQGCFWEKNNTIYVLGTLSPEDYTLTFLHEYGHFYMQDEKDFSLFAEEEKSAIGEWDSPEEYAADEFAYWMLGANNMPSDESVYFTNLIAQKNVTH